METTNTFAWTQVAEIELIYKSKVKASKRPKVNTSHDAYNLFKQTWDQNKIEFIEQFKVLFFNRANKVLAIYELSTGGVSGTVADPKLIFAAALNSFHRIVSKSGMKPFVTAVLCYSVALTPKTLRLHLVQHKYASIIKTR